MTMAPSTNRRARRRSRSTKAPAIPRRGARAPSLWSREVRQHALGVAGNGGRGEAIGRGGDDRAVSAMVVRAPLRMSLALLLQVDDAPAAGTGAVVGVGVAADDTAVGAAVAVVALAVVATESTTLLK